jgi:uncharacterized SAM-binding protein YcdF (DUF218 family)
MTDEPKASNTPESNPARKNPYCLPVGVLLVLITISVPLYSLKKYAQILQKEIPQSRMTLLTADCGVVLTGAAGRVREGIALLSHGQVQKLIMSGVHQHSTLAEMFPEILFYPEIKLENVILERRSNSTAGNAQSSLPIVEALNCQSILLITHDYHMYRAQKTFNQIFPGSIKIIPYAIASDRLQLRPNALFDTRYWGTVFEEWYKYIFYEIFVFTG